MISQTLSSNLAAPVWWMFCCFGTIACRGWTTHDDHRQPAGYSQSASKLLTWLPFGIASLDVIFWRRRKYYILCTSISTTHDIRYSRQSMLKDPQIERAQNPSNTFTFWFDSPFIYQLQVSYKTSHKANMSDRGNTRKYPIKFFQYPIIPDWLYIWCQYPYPIRTRSDPKYFFQYPIHTRPEVEKPYPSAPGYKTVITKILLNVQYQLIGISTSMFLPRSITRLTSYKTIITSTHSAFPDQVSSCNKSIEEKD